MLTAGLACTVTASVGFASIRAGEELLSTIERADATLYRAKHAGRNRTAGAVD